MKVNLGGDRIGSGAKMQQEVYNYSRSTFNLSKNFRSSLAPGILYPGYVGIATKADVYELDMKTITRTLPTKGPLFGSYKQQIDVFVCPIRLYNGVLHNNPRRIGLQMNQVKLPKITIASNKPNDSKQIDPRNLWKYFGMSGIGRPSEQMDVIKRSILGLPLLAYGDIFKNYYANQQENNFHFVDFTNHTNEIGYKIENNRIETAKTEMAALYPKSVAEPHISSDQKYYSYAIQGTESIIEPNGYVSLTALDLKIDDTQIINGTKLIGNIYSGGSSTGVQDQYSVEINVVVTVSGAGLARIIKIQNATGKNIGIQYIHVPTKATNEKHLIIQNAPLEDFDTMRELLLETKLGETFQVEEKATEYNLEWYRKNTTAYPEDITKPLCGMLVKTYQSDLFNNWLNSEQIVGNNGIAEITTIDTSNGLKMDALNLAQKVYNMLNRIAISGGTYEDWLEAVYGAEQVKRGETPIYVGGMSNEIAFEEVVATTAADTKTDGTQSLGSLGGRGREVNEKGGKVVFDVEEPSIIIAMVSLTPRICYSQGNKWFLTDIDTLDDFHKPALDGIGFQDLLVEQAAFTGTSINAQGQVVERLSMGKTLAWANWMTDIDECYGDFADENAAKFMVLDRNYQITDINGNLQAPSDITTYIDPAKFNYAFNYAEIDAQNFWCEINFDLKVRRLMSAKQIPNL